MLSLSLQTYPLCLDLQSIAITSRRQALISSVHSFNRYFPSFSQNGLTSPAHIPRCLRMFSPGPLTQLSGVLFLPPNHHVESPGGGFYVSARSGPRPRLSAHPLSFIEIEKITIERGGTQESLSRLRLVVVHEGEIEEALALEVEGLTVVTTTRTCVASRCRFSPSPL